MTVEELIKVSEQKLSNSSVCVSVKGNTYVIGGVVMKLGGIVTIQGYNWTLVSNGVVIVGS